MGMEVEFRIDMETGELETEVINRNEHLCSEVYKVTNAIGTQISDEEIGPECDEVHEINNG